MSDQVNLKAEKRDDMGSAAVGRLRRGGKIPGVVYGSTQESYAVQIDTSTIKNLLRNSASQQILVNLQIEGAKETNKLALIQDVQQHAISGDILHIDFNAVKEDSEIHARVPIELIGDPVGIKQGGILDTLLHDIEVHCLPKDLPAALKFDVSELDIGDSLSIASAEFPEGVSAALDGEVLIAIVNETRAALSEGEDEGDEEGEEQGEGEGEDKEGQSEDGKESS